MKPKTVFALILCIALSVAATIGASIWSTQHAQKSMLSWSLPLAQQTLVQVKGLDTDENSLVTVHAVKGKDLPADGTYEINEQGHLDYYSNGVRILVKANSSDRFTNLIVLALVFGVTLSLSLLIFARFLGGEADPRTKREVGAWVKISQKDLTALALKFKELAQHAHSLSSSAEKEQNTLEELISRIQGLTLENLQEEMTKIDESCEKIKAYQQTTTEKSPLVDKNLIESTDSLIAYMKRVKELGLITEFDDSNAA